MITTIIAVTVGTVALVNVLLSQSSHQTIKVETHQTSPSSTPVMSITVIPHPTHFPTPTPPDIAAQLDQAHQKAQEQVDHHRQQAIDQVNRQIDQAIDQLESTQLQIPPQATSIATPILTQQQLQLEHQRQQMINQLNQQLQWPD